MTHCIADFTASLTISNLFLIALSSVKMKELFSGTTFQVAFGEQNSTEVLKDIKDESKGRTLTVIINY